MATLVQPRMGIPRRVSPALVAGRAPVREVFFTKTIDNSLIYKEHDGSTRRECLLLGGLMVSLFVLLSAFAWVHFQCVNYGYQIEQTRQAQRELTDANHRLELIEASLEDPKVIDSRARAELGMSEPDPRQVVRVERPGSPLAPPSEPELAMSRPGAVAIWARLARLR